ncbi:MAG: acylphosphatase [Ignavibacteria bacterium]|nr:acylphosphatase [Ignavibacteria bacterium]MBI3766827.1 acylphosphatase [Ignavibacteriales bacterium]
MYVGANIIVSGMVQGVGFRYFVHTWATRLGLVGYVTNLYNGDVEIETEGVRSLIETLIEEVKAGPRSAHVSDVKVKWKTSEHSFHGFEIR